MATATRSRATPGVRPARHAVCELCGAGAVRWRVFDLPEHQVHGDFGDRPMEREICRVCLGDTRSDGPWDREERLAA